MTNPIASLATSLAAGRERARAHAAERDAHARARAGRAQVRRPDAELEVLAREAELRFADETDAGVVLRWAAAEFGDLLAVACSMADVVLPHVVAEHSPWVDVLFLDTGYHFPETLGTRDSSVLALRATIVDVRSELTVAEQDATYGPRLYERDPGACCRMRKVEPLSRALGGYEAWVTGVRRDEGPTRADTPLVTWDANNRLVKLNPLAAWSFDDVLAHAGAHQLPANPLLADGYPSIGCAPCTSRVAPGADPRSGRWAGLDKTECGLHT